MSPLHRTITTRFPQVARRFALAGAVVVAAGLAAGCGSDDGAQIGDKAAIQAKMDRLVELGVPGITVLVRDGDRSLQLSSGIADLKTKRAVDKDDRFRIGSLAKPYVGVLMAQLAEEGKLHLDDPIDLYQPGSVTNGADISLRQLLNHSSGIADYTEVSQEVLAPYLKGDYAHVWKPSRLVKIAAAAGPLFEPGTDVHYSNTNYALLGQVIEKVTGNTLADEMRTRIFRPLKLENTSFATNGKLTEPFARGYLVGQGKPVDVTEIYPYYWGAGNLVADADDVARFSQALMGGKLVSAASLREMKRLVMQTKTRGQGLGIVGDRLSCGRHFGHDGSVPGYFSYSIVMSGGRQVVFLANSVTIEDSIANPKAQRQLESLVETAACST